jgi:hypothetical protein
MVVGEGGVARFGGSEFRLVTVVPAFAAGGDVILVIGDRQCDGLRFGEFGAVTGVVAVPAIRDVASVEDES